MQIQDNLFYKIKFIIINEKNVMIDNDLCA